MSSDVSFSTRKNVFQWGGDEDDAPSDTDDTIVQGSDAIHRDDVEGEPDLPLNDTPFEDIDPEFKKSFLEAKYALYSSSVLSPNEDSTEAQDLRLHELYEVYLKMFDVLCKAAKEGKPIPRVSMSLFPPASVASVTKTIQWLTTFFLNNSPRITLPYSHFIYHHLYTNIFLQA